MKKIFKYIPFIALFALLFTSCEEDGPAVLSETFVKFQKNSVSKTYTFYDTEKRIVEIELNTLGAFPELPVGIELEINADKTTTSAAQAKIVNNQLKTNQETGVVYAQVEVNTSEFTFGEEKVIAINIKSSDKVVVEKNSLFEVKIKKDKLPVFTYGDKVNETFAYSADADTISGNLYVNVDKEIYQDVTLNLELDFSNIPADSLAAETDQFTISKSVTLKKGEKSAKVPYKLFNKDLLHGDAKVFAVRLKSQAGCTEGAVLPSDSVAVEWNNTYTLDEAHWTGNVTLTGDKTFLSKTVNIPGTDKFLSVVDFSSELGYVQNELKSKLVFAFDKSNPVKVRMSIESTELNRINGQNYWELQTVNSGRVFEPSKGNFEVNGLGFDIIQYNWETLKDKDGNPVLDDDDNEVKGWVKDETKREYRNYTFKLN